MKKYTSVKSNLLKKAKIRRAYDALGPEYDLVRAIIRKRIAKGITQEELAERLGTRQSAISRLESGMSNPTVSFLRHVARALDGKLKISL